MSSVRKASKPSAGAPPIITRAPRPFCLLGIIAEYARHTTPITLRFSEGRHSFFKDVMNITDAVTNALVFRVEVKAFSLSGKKTLIDHAGRRLFDFYRAGGGLSTTYQGESCDETKKLLFTVDKIGTSESELFIAFDNLAADGRRQRWSVKGRWLPGVSQIANMSGLAVANISRDFSDFCFLWA
uniref:Uncharacterized protein n=1 Tax=Kalmanozyma brasiliensis (strain GHG001) TaxID=1365824 RepID=V5GUR8_KALBG